MDKSKTMFVIGSGPSGVSATYALLNKGYKVVMLDVGISLEKNIDATVEKLAKSDCFSPTIVSKIKHKMQNSFGKDNKKYVYGSDYPYKEVDKLFKVKLEGVSCLPTFGKGGLSAVWGAACMPWLSQDMKDWPISGKDLSSHYKAVLEFMPLGAYKDDLARISPLYTKKFQEFHMSRQAKNLLLDLNKNKKELQREGFIFGASRLAVQFKKNSRWHGCTYCGLCMYGCPYGLIYNSASTLKDFLNNDNFSYISGIVVNNISEKDGKVIISAKENEKNKTFVGDRIFIGAGVLSTAVLMMNSLSKKDVVIKDSQHFLIPLLRYKGVSNVEEEELHTLSQVFIELFDKKIDEHSIHLQIYSYNDLYGVFLQKKLGPLYRILKPLISILYGRVLVMQGYIHSDSSSKVLVKLEKNGYEQTLHLKRILNDKSKGKIKKILKKMAKNNKRFGLIPIMPLLTISKACEGNHYGCTFPMSKNPKELESDVLGRPYGFKKVHIIDASVLPTICTQTITLNVMANAHRIASLCESERLRK